MSYEKQFSLKYIAKEVARGPLDTEIYREGWEGLRQFLYACLVFVVRVLMLLTYPLSVPGLWAFFLVMAPINAKRRKARNERVAKNYRDLMKEN